MFVKPLLTMCFTLFVPFHLQALAQDTPSAGQVGIRGITYSGSGCPQGTVATNLSPDAQAFTMTFSDYMVAREGRNVESGDVCGPNLFNPRNHPAAGPRAALRPISCKRCQIQLDITPPQGWSYGLVSFQTRGYATVDQGASGIQNAQISFGRGQKTKLGRMTIEGPYDDDYQRADDVPLRNIVWSKCNQPPQPLQLDTVIAVKTNDSARALMTVDSVDGTVNQQYGLIWKRCGNGGGGGGGGGNQRAFGASCKVALVNPNRGNQVKKEFAATGYSAASTSEAQQKGAAKAMQKCQSRSGNRNLVCQPAVCQSAQL